MSTTLGDALVQPAVRLLRGEEEPVFGEPWQAHAFAITVSLHRTGLFTWREWADELAACITQAQSEGDPDLGDTYYQHWLQALERLVAAKGASTPGELEHLRLAWARAAERTPHGRPIELLAADLVRAAFSPPSEAARR